MPRIPPAKDWRERQKIKELHAEGKTYREIQDLTGRSQGYISDALKDRWKRGGEVHDEPPYDPSRFRSGDVDRDGAQSSEPDERRGSGIDLGEPPTPPPAREDEAEHVLEGDAADQDDDQDDDVRTVVF